jgi:DNA-binding transcriptional LysR family regulator
VPTASLHITLRQLEYALAVADDGTMSGAAETLNVSQSAVSMAVAGLEQALGVQLFMRRKAKGVTLTGVGRTVLPEIRRLLTQAEDLQSTARGLGQSVGGPLALGCYPPLTPFLVPRILNAFPRRHPLVDIRLFEGSVDELQERLVDGRCEVALMYESGIGPDVTATRLYTLRPYVILPADHRLAREADAIHLADLRDEPMVMPDMPPSEDLYREILSGAGVEPTVSFTATTAEALRSLVACGVGYSLVLQRPSPATTYAGPPLRYREIADDIRSVDVVLAHAKAARLTSRARAFSDFCREVLP